MLDTLTFNNLRDFGPRYTHTYGWLINGEKKDLVYISRVQADRLTFNTVDHEECYAKIDAGVMFEFIPVNHGWFNSQDGQTYFLTRVPARQWKRGISDSNTSVRSYVHMGRQLELSLQLLGGIFNDKFKELNYSKEWRVGAWSKHFCLTPKDAVMFYDRVIGRFTKGEVRLNNSLVYQELSDLFRRNGWTVPIVINEDNGAA